MKKKLTIIELNEFNLDLLKDYAFRFNLVNIQDILKSKVITTFSKDKKEHFGLDPWVQWVSIHTGLPSEVHKIKALGTGNQLVFNQIWDVLVKNKISVGIWGAMNSVYRKSNLLKFFIPDPWSYNELCHPSELNEFLSLPKYFAKNYIQPNIFKLLICFVKTISFLIKQENFILLKNDLYFIFRLIIFNGINNSVLFSIFDLVSSMIFIKYSNSFSPEFTVIFLNSLAHNQHHNWHLKKRNKNMIVCLETLDRIFLKLRKAGFFDQSYIIFNGLSQERINKEYNIYRQRNPKKFFKKLNIKYLRLEQAMTNDGHMLFEDKDKMKDAKKLIDNLKIDNKKLFFTYSKFHEDNYLLFYRLDFYDDVSNDKYFYSDKKRFSFNKHFMKLVKRTGSHIDEGTALYKGIDLENISYNHDFFKYILKYFGISKN